MLKRIKKILLVGLSTMLFLSANASAATISTVATFPDSLPIQINEGERVQGNVDFSQPFPNISEISFTITFSNDDWNSGETIAIFFPGPFGAIGIAATNTGFNFSHDHYTLTTSAWRTPIDSLSDGATDFYIEMQSGSVDIDNVTFSVTTVPLPSSILLMLSGLVFLRTIQKKQKL